MGALPRQPLDALDAQGRADERRAGRRTLASGAFVVGNKIYAGCRDCGQVVQLNKPVIGSLHICV